MDDPTTNRCKWPGTDIDYIAYHDTEWGRAVLDDRALWEKLILDGFQAGLSWITILRKRDNFIEAFDGFRPEVIAEYGEDKVAELMQNTGIVRNQLKIRSTVTNAQAYLRMMEEGSFSDFLWSFTNGAPQVNGSRDERDNRATSPESDAMSKALKKSGFKFVGSTICYAFMQAVGIVNDHLLDCYCRQECIDDWNGIRDE